MAPSFKSPFGRGKKKESAADVADKEQGDAPARPPISGIDDEEDEDEPTVAADQPTQGAAAGYAASPSSPSSALPPAAGPEVVKPAAVDPTPPEAPAVPPQPLPAIVASADVGGEEAGALVPAAPAEAPPLQEEPAGAIVAADEAQGPKERSLVAFARRVRAGEVELHVPDLPAGPRLPSLGLWDKITSLPYRYCQVVARYPAIWMAVILLACILTVSIAWRSIEVDTDVSAFRRVDGNSSRDYDVYAEAVRHLRASKNASSLFDRKTFQIELLYEAKQTGDRDNSVFEEAVLRDIRNFEQKLRALDGWGRVCGKVDSRATQLCEPGESLGNYVWPTRLDNYLTSSGYFRLTFDGLAQERLPVPATLTYLLEGAAAPHDPWLFLPQQFADRSSASVLLRSVFTFIAPSLDSSAFEEEFKELAQEELYPFLVEVVDNTTNDVTSDSWEDPLRMKLYFRGDELSEHEVMESLGHDMLFALAALFISLLVTWVHLESLFLALVTLTTLCFSVLLAYIFVNVEEVSLANFLVVFIVFGLGGNSFFKLKDLWARVYLISPMAAPANRVATFYRQAIWQMSPVILIAFIFWVFLLSSMRPLREFGFFMGTCMLCRCVLSLLAFVPALVLEEQVVKPLLARRLPPKLQQVISPVALRLPYPKIADIFLKIAHQGKIVWIATAACAVVGGSIASIVVAVDDRDGLPLVFAPGHQRSDGQTLFEEFEVAGYNTETVSLDVTMCEPWRASLSSCGLHWCDVDSEESTYNSSAEGCHCWRDDSATRATSCSSLRIEVQISGDEAAEDYSEDDWKASAEAFISESWTGVSDISWASSASSRPSVVFEHWASGTTSIESLTQLPTATTTLTAMQGTSTCTERLFCFCGERKCSSSDDYSLVSRRLAFPSEARRLQKASSSSSSSSSASSSSSYSSASFSPKSAARSSASRLARHLAGSGAAASTIAQGGRSLSETSLSAQVAGQESTEVFIIYGITPPTSGMLFNGVPEWSFDTTFEPDSPWSQRAMLSICVDAPDSLKVLARDCWIEGFREWLIAQGETFPVQRFGSFAESLSLYMLASPSVAGDLWLNSDSNMRASRFRVRVADEATPTEVLDARQRWLEFVASTNAAAATTASKAWVAAREWAEAEAYTEALASTWIVAILVLVAIALVGFWYMQDFEMLVLMVVICVVAFAYLAFWMFCIFQWEFGPWELTLMCIVLTYSVEPAFRIGHDFVKPPAGKWVVQKHPEGDPDSSDHQQHPPLPPPEDADEDAALGPRVDPASSMFVHASPTGIGVEDIPSDLQSIASSGDGDPAEDSPEMAVRRSIHHQCGAVFMGSLKIFLCGWFLLPCNFRLFTRVGAVAIVVSLAQVVCTLILLPSALLLSKRQRREPDIYPIGRLLHDNLAWIWT